jgi:hypothetical protein
MMGLRDGAGMIRHEFLREVILHRMLIKQSLTSSVAMDRHTRNSTIFAARGRIINASSNHWAYLTLRDFAKLWPPDFRSCLRLWENLLKVAMRLYVYF